MKISNISISVLAAAILLLAGFGLAGSRENVAGDKVIYDDVPAAAVSKPLETADLGEEITEAGARPAAGKSETPSGATLIHGGWAPDDPEGSAYAPNAFYAY